MVVWSAVIASCAIPVVFASVELLKKTKDGKLEPYYMTSLRGNFKFVDGSVACDLPMARMSELFNINTYIVSQVNPHVAPFITSDAVSIDESRLKRLILQKTKTIAGNTLRYSLSQLNVLGLMPSYITGIADLIN